MAIRNPRYALAIVALPILFLAMSGMARATTFTVFNTNDTGIGSLRDAITSANAAPTVANTINFSVSGTITLGSTLPAIANTAPGSLTIDGSGHAITVDGANSFQILSVNSGATLTLKFLTLLHGSPLPFGEGGAISNNGTVTVANSTFSDNQAAAGGAIENTGTLSVTNSTFSDNQAIIGGAIRNEVFGPFAPPAMLTVTNSTFSDNLVRPSEGQVGPGGAIDNEGSTVIVTNSTFSGNQAFGGLGSDGFGGAIANLAHFDTPPIQIPGTLMVTNSTFLDNKAEVGAAVGGAIANSFSTASLNGTILAGSTGGNCANLDASLTADLGYNISDDNSCGFSGTSVNDSTTLHLDPAGLANNGGPTQTIALEPNSEAIDFIPVASCTDQSSPTPLPVITDQRGLPRPDPDNPDFCDAGAFELQTMPFVLAPNSERLQIARSTTPNSDQINMAVTFTENGFPACDSADNAFNVFTVLLRSGSCGALDDGSLELMLEPWVVHTVNHQSYGTLFQSLSPGTVSARMVQLPTPAAPACGEWTVNIEVAGIDSSGLGNGPFALVLSNPDGDQGCFDITNAIVGSQIPTPSHSVRRGVRRQTRR